MSKASLPIIVGIAVSLALLAAWLLPGVSLGDAARTTAESPGLARPVTAFVPELVAADTLLRGDGAVVLQGDTLALRRSDPYGLLREDLLALSRGQATPADALAVRREYGDTTEVLAEADSLLRAIERATARQPRTLPHADFEPDLDPELLRAEMMGAEDAIDDLTERLRLLSPPTGPDDRQQALAIAREISRRRAFLSDARERLRTRSLPRRTVREVVPPRLTVEQRARITGLAARLRPDTQYVLSPATGTLVLADGPARVVGLPGAQRTADGGSDDAPAPPQAVEGVYELRSAGLPTLWSRAERRDSLSARPSRPTIVVAPR